MKKKMILIVFSLLVISIMIFYYKEKISLLVKEEGHFWQLFFDASQINSLSLRIIISFIVIASFSLLIELLILGWKKSALKKLFIKPSKSAIVDWVCYALSVFKLFEFFSFILTLGLFYFLSSILTKIIQLNLLHFVENETLKFILLFVFIDFVSYWRHRVNHMKGFWELHLFHHSAVEFNLITTTRGSFFEAAFNTIFSTLVFVIMGAEVETIVWLAFTREVYQFLIHSEINWSLGWFGKYIFISPKAHKLHHSVRKEDYDLNFGFVFN